MFSEDLLNGLSSQKYFTTTCNAQNWPAEGALAPLTHKPDFHSVTLKCIFLNLDQFRLLFCGRCRRFGQCNVAHFCRKLQFQACAEISGTSWMNSRHRRARLQTASAQRAAPSSRSFLHRTSSRPSISETARSLTLLVLQSFFLISRVVKNGRGHVAGGRETKNQILARAGRRCRGASREITEGAAR